MPNAQKKLDCGVYAITHVDSGKRYIGSSKQIKERLTGHKWLLNKNKHPNFYLQSAWNKHGVDKFSFAKILVCAPEDRIFYEQRIIDGFKVTDHSYGYNLSLKASHPQHSLETIEKIKAKLKIARLEGRVPGHHQPHTKEARKRISDGQAKAKKEGRIGGHFTPHTEESKKKMSEALKGKPCWAKGKHHSDASRAKMSISQKIRFARPEEIEKRKAQTHCKNGHPLSGDNIFRKLNSNIRVCRICSNNRVKMCMLRKKNARNK